jgi:NAD(P)-dependent dehydrogenase (short-subunit alcohol dehydrogenase family)
MQQEQHVLVTGANSGIGLATALELARRGFRVTGSVRSEAKAEVVAEAAAEAGVEVATVELDVTDAERCEEVMAQLGTLHGLVNNAGYGVTGAIEDVPDDEARAALETMVVAPMRLARLAIPGMREAGGGRILNVSSIYGRMATPLTGWYQGAKHALEGLSDALRIEVAKDGIHVILIEPGGFRTNIWADLERDLAKREGSRYDAAYQRIGGLTSMWSPLMGEPASCAKVIGRALRTPVPRPRYLVGTDAKLASVADALTPSMVKDRVLRIAQGL